MTSRFQVDLRSCVSVLLADDFNAKQVQFWLGETVSRVGGC